MYGTIARLHPRPDRVAELEALGESLNVDPPPGYVASWLFRPDRNPYFRETMFLIAVFEDAESYRTNADTPEQHARYLEMRDLLMDEPDWIDGHFEPA